MLFVSENYCCILSCGNFFPFILCIFFFLKTGLMVLGHQLKVISGILERHLLKGKFLLMSIIYFYTFARSFKTIVPFGKICV